MAQPQRILIVRPSALGDVCRSVGILVSLRRRFPDARIDWLVQKDFAPAIAAHPDLNSVVTFPRDRFADWWYNPVAAWDTVRWFNRLRHRRYDTVFDFQGLGRSGLITWASRARRRVGFRDAREFAWLGYNVHHPAPKAVHTVDQMLELLASDGIETVADLRLYVGRRHHQWWTDRRDAHEMRRDRYAVIAPTSRWPSKRWPLEGWQSLRRPLLDRGFERLVFIGAPSERDQVREMVADTRSGRVIDLVGQTSIGQTMAVIAEASLVIANDSAPLHMAVGFDRPSIGLFGPTDPRRVGPYGDAPMVIRKFEPVENEIVRFRSPRIGDSLMRLIEPEEVLRAVDELMHRGAIRVDQADDAGPIARIGKRTAW